MGIRTDKGLRQWFLFYSLLLMVFGLFTSRALLSVSLLLFVFLTCFHRNIGQQVRRLFTHRFLFFIALLFLVPLVSGWWSDDSHEWMRWARIKLPLLLLPLAFAGHWSLPEKQWQQVAFAFLLMLFLGCCTSLGDYLSHAGMIHQDYLRAKVFNTPLGNDHVRFSLVVCTGVVCSFLLLRRGAYGRPGRAALWFLVVFFVVYLHVLAARTGLAGLYIFLLLLLAHRLSRRSGRPVTLALLAAIVVLPLIAWLALPTFRNRVKYVLYDLSFIRKAEYLPGGSDGDRMLSLQAGWSILRQHPAGVGCGDVMQETNRWYEAHVPGMLPTDKLYPSSEWLLYGDAAGWAGACLFTLAMLMPFFEKKGKAHIFWISLNIIAAFSLLFDIGLETQFGVFIYAFIILWWWKWLQKDRNAGINHELSMLDNHHLPERSGKY